MGPGPARLRRSRASRIMSRVTWTVSSGGAPPSAVAASGASGVTPTMWVSATAPVAAAAAQKDLSRSSGTGPGMPSTAETASPAIRPTRAPSTAKNASSRRSGSGSSETSNESRAARFSGQCSP